MAGRPPCHLPRPRCVPFTLTVSFPLALSLAFPFVLFCTLLSPLFLSLIPFIPSASFPPFVRQLVNQTESPRQSLLPLPCMLFVFPYVVCYLDFELDRLQMSWHFATDGRHSSRCFHCLCSGSTTHGCQDGQHTRSPNNGYCPDYWH